jgi:hypothetical protein
MTPFFQLIRIEFSAFYASFSSFSPRLSAISLISPIDSILRRLIRFHAAIRSRHAFDIFVADCRFIDISLSFSPFSPLTFTPPLISFH